MTSRNNKLFSILLFALGVFFSNTAQAQSCQPVLYLFRHAEDVNTALTSVGNRHADLYPSMVRRLEESSFNHCPVARVFAMWNRNGAGTTNPFNTALPLAQAVGGMSATPEFRFQDADSQGNSHQYYLCEFYFDGNCESSGGIPAPPPYPPPLPSPLSPSPHRGPP
jgi:hypothetical protein